MATAIFFNGRRINIPGAYTEVDASELASTSPAATGVVALLGTAQGGKPLSAEPADADSTTPSRLREKYKGGDLRIAGQFAFEPSNDDSVPGGAQRLISLKVNPDTQAEATLQDDEGNDTLDLVSNDYGVDQNQISIEIGDGTNQGKLLTVRFQDDEEIFDDVGGDSIITVEPITELSGSIEGHFWRAGAFFNDGSRLKQALVDILGQKSSEVTQPASDSILTLISDSSVDSQEATIYGEDSAQEPVKETVKLSGLNPVTTTQSFTVVHGVILAEEANGTITVDDSVPATLVTFSAGEKWKGANPTAGPSFLNPNGKVITFYGIGDGTADDSVAIWGTDENGQATAEVLQDLTSWSTTPVVTATKWRSIEAIASGNSSVAARFVVEIDFPFDDFDTVGKIRKGLENKVHEIDVSLGVSGSFLSTRLDKVNDGNTVINILDSTVEEDEGSLWDGTAPETATLHADTWSILNELNESSDYITASFATSSSKKPAANTNPIFLFGGTDGIASIDEWREAFKLLEKRFVNTIVPLTNDPAVHSLMLTHLLARGGRLQNKAGEANGYVGLSDSDGNGETRANIKSQIQAFANRNITAISQRIKRFNPDTGEAEFFPPHYFAAVAAGMQAGSPIGEPLTYKTIIATDVDQDASWNPEEDASEMIESGLMVAEKVDGIGIRWVRSVTTHLADDNVVYVETSANEALNRAVFELRRRLNLATGNRGLANSAASIKGLASGVLGEMIDDEIIVAWKSLAVEQVGDVYPVSVELAPVLPINFIPATVHVTTVRQAA